MAIHKRVFRTVASLFGSDGDGQHAGDASRISHDRVPPRPTQKHLQTSPLNRREFDKTHEIPVADESAKFDEALSRLIGKRERLVAGSLEIIGLDDVRDALGAASTKPLTPREFFPYRATDRGVIQCLANRPNFEPLSVVSPRATIQGIGPVDREVPIGDMCMVHVRFGKIVRSRR